MKPIPWFFGLFRRTPLRTIVNDELHEAFKKLLEAETGLEYAKSQVAYRTEQVARLKQRVMELP